jgi:ribosomal subunit interface protein
VNIIFKGRHTDVLDRFRKHAMAKLSKIEKLDSRATRVDVEVSAERNPRQSGRRERVELTISSRGPAIRAEAAAEDRYAALDLAYSKLESRLRRAGDRRKCRHAAHAARVTDLPAADDIVPRQARDEPAPSAMRDRTRDARDARDAQDTRDALEARDARDVAESEGAAGDGSQADGVVPIEMEGDGPLVVREKVHIARPMAIDQALFEMELVGHDFFLFRDTGSGRPSVVYRRRGYQYGVIRLMEEAAGDGTDLSSGNGTLSQTGEEARKTGELAAR